MKRVHHALLFAAALAASATVAVVEARAEDIKLRIASGHPPATPTST